ncbi:enoyl-CoA hydratase/isomerase family protein [Natronoglycomyces albus]|uniref:Enoyl-CoA hydratase/isomerase family protein n=1 Tax=Natronoglycomyces albus TaxID=2811108 RepID=A0A895XNP2_9ACTN|nr:enoyl-CoA hydratase/isomerase family protein [Natronoglycomyces albus]
MPELPDFPDEVITEALVQYVRVPGVDGEAALITLDNGHDHTKPSSIGPAGLKNLWNALDEIEARSPRVKFIAVTGKPFIFLAGADITAMDHLQERDQALAMAQGGHAAYARLRDSEIPTFAFINGVTLGGGLELALHCHYRTISTGAKAVGLPEVAIGLVPAWGGSQLLPNLIGMEKAAQVILENPLNQNRMLKGPDVTKLGIADAEFEPADFLEESFAWAAKVLNGEVTVERPEVDKGEAWDTALAKAEAFVEGKVRGSAPAAYRALKLLKIAKDTDYSQAILDEDEALADLMVTPEHRSSLYSFNLLRKRGKKPSGAPSKGLANDVKKVGVVGAGLMASQIALLFARRLEVPVVMTDLDEERAAKGLSYIHSEIDKMDAKGRLGLGKADKLRSLVSAGADKSVYADCDLVIEAVFEDISIKHAVFGELEKIVPQECLLVTNTSGLSLTEMASRLQHPERLVGLHFFNPVAVMPLVEVIAVEQTNDETLATAFAVVKKLKKTGVLVKDAPAFVVNRLLVGMLAQAMACIDEGTPIEDVDRAVDPLGLPMTPTELLGLVGVGVGLHVTEHLNASFGDRFPVSENLKALVKLESEGSKAFEKNEAGKFELTEAGRNVLTLGDKPSTTEEVHARVVANMASEARKILDEGVVAGPEEIDLCMILGAGFPFSKGGITPYLDRIGVAKDATGSTFDAKL